ncbi:TPA: type II toxin-antitoxin system RelE/ParE family toxin [Photobacterium damselae]|uniref:Type II toxin-antitoxin system RelE/ParE family toxin n=1 Tax=Photobacterium damselae subsp. damselae TaxID=85581 RepID=A0A850QU08_PHODD|nr:type II toxin-antitoxin system RelE/ParE family toxin [Photobacterium damselae]KAB1174242.1 type II toxin-antitoxin system RelE/ParE family toxin [Photobacterium damselae subsp. damselae]MBA5683827.1 type II toxin-antitoxin system RelE/ParE family toxin [Photobacterium damselae subsp. damselae]MCG9705099.1 type II toxin-antitoxin system RelE/ParE family toxin [Photobacterium damselae]NVH46819.1 type II toxin-antitoxin system RelE/ParE family toxin [Photobacterium damselae subsp. damselae]NV
MYKSRYKLSQLAQSHLRKIKSYTTENFSELQWSNYKAILISGFQMLADNPDLGKHCADIYPNGFYFPIGKHTVFFTKEDDFILVVAVLGQTQLPQNHLK